MDEVHVLDLLLHRCALPLLCTHGAEAALLLRLSPSYAHDPPNLRAASRTLHAGAPDRTRSARTLLHACVKARVTLRRLREVMSHAPASAFSECNGAGETPLSLAWGRVKAGNAPSLARALTLASSPHSRGEDWHRVGTLFYLGEVVTQDDTAAAVWYRQAADQGLAGAQFCLGNMYNKGRGVPQGDVQAVAWWRNAAEQGFAPAQYNLGLMYDRGRGVPQDTLQAAAWWRKAAEQGYAGAQYNLGVMYDRGRGVPQDYAQAAAWWRKAADQGFADAQYNLGGMYHEGYGVPQDDAQAVAWMRKAADQGDALARAKLAGVGGQ